MIKLIDTQIEGEFIEEFEFTGKGFSFLLELTYSGQDWEENFKVMLCDIEGLTREIEENDISYASDGFCELNSYGVIVLKQFNKEQLIKRINQITEEVNDKIKCGYNPVLALTSYYSYMP